MRIQVCAFWSQPLAFCGHHALTFSFCASPAPEVLKPTTGAAPAPVVCPVDWHLFNNSCYFISRTSRDWPESQSYCQSQGGHLAIIHTAEEQVRWSSRFVSSSFSLTEEQRHLFLYWLQKHVYLTQAVLKQNFMRLGQEKLLTSLDVLLMRKVDTV